jgi:hypothetical protein
MKWTMYARICCEAENRILCNARQNTMSHPKDTQGAPLSVDDTLVIGKLSEDPPADDAGKNRSQPIPAATPDIVIDEDPPGGGFNPYDKVAGAKPEPQRRSIQSIVAEQRTKDKKP